MISWMLRRCSNLFGYMPEQCNPSMALSIPSVSSYLISTKLRYAIKYGQWIGIAMAARIPSSVGENPAVTRGSDRSAIETFISFESLPGCPGMEWRKGLDYFTRQILGRVCLAGMECRKWEAMGIEPMIQFVYVDLANQYLKPLSHTSIDYRLLGNISCLLNLIVSCCFPGFDGCPSRPNHGPT